MAERLACVPGRTNIWLERLLSQDRDEEVRLFLSRQPSNLLYVTDFAVHSIGIILTRLGRSSDLTLFVNDLFIHGATNLVHLEPADTSDLLRAIDLYGFDYDDAYQYVAAYKLNLRIVSFDSDFDKTDKGRTAPKDIL